MKRFLIALALALGVLSPAFAADTTPLKNTNGHPGGFAAGDTVGVAHGGTGLSTLTAHCVTIGAGTSAAHLVCPTTSGYVLTDNGAGSDPSFQAAAGGTPNLTGSTGLVAQTGSGAYSARTLTAPAAGISVSNGSGVSGNPTLALANDLAALEGLSGTGVAVRTGTDTWNTRTLTAGAGISISNGDGTGGNPTITAVGSGISGSAPYVYTNPPFANVTSLLHFDGTNGSTTITDQVLTAWTAVGSATISTAQSVFGGASLTVPGSSNSSVKHTTSSGFDVGSGDWSIEFRWLYIGAPQTSARVFATRDGDTFQGIGLTIDASSVLSLSISFNGSTYYSSAPVGTLSQTAFNKIIIQRRGSIIESFLDGTLINTLSIGSNSIYYNSGDTVIIGGNATGASRSMNAYIDEFRFTKGAYVMVPGNPVLPSSAFPNS